MLRMKAERLAQGTGQSEFARITGMHVSTIWAVETGHQKPFPGQKRSIALALGWPEDRADELFEEVPDGASHPATLPR